MAEKYKKIDKEFQLTDSTVNSYGFRLLTSGYLLDEFKKNPIGYYMHKRDDGVLVKWDDLRADGDKVFGKPVINLSHPRGEKTIDEIENNFLNAASVGHIVALEISDDAKLKLPGQEGPTVTRWFNRECSVVDIPGNYNSFKLFDKDDNEINLADFQKQKINMKQIHFTAAQLAAMNLSADADDAAVTIAFNDLVAKAKKADEAESAKQKAESNLADFKKTTNKKIVADMLATALNVDKKINKALHDKLLAVYEINPDELKGLLDLMPKYVSIADQLDKNKEANTKLAAMSWEELDKQGKLEDLKAKDFELFKSKYQERFGKEYSKK